MSFSPDDLDVPVNNLSPIRVALLGGDRVGKTSILSKLSQGIYSDTYYPTFRTNTNLFTFAPESLNSRAVLDTAHSVTPRPTHQIVLSQTLSQRRPTKPRPDVGSAEVVVTSTNDLYSSFHRRDEGAGPPRVTPILVELVDTPAFNPDMFVPFLEASLYINLGKDVLHNLANEQRRPVSTNPLLVASGAGELNGSIDGYFLVYSAVPSMAPPSYDAAVSNADGPPNDNVQMLPTIKEALDDAWKEYYTFKRMWDQGQEADIYSLKTALKNVFQSKTVQEMEAQRQQKRKLYTELLEVPHDPSNPKSPPPVWIVCTSMRSPLMSQQLVDAGKQLARQWKCGFVGVDLTHAEDLDLAMALMVRELVERRSLQKAKRK